MDTPVPTYRRFIVRIRPLAALSVAALSALILAGCSSAAPEASPSASATAGDLCGSAIASGSISDSVEVQGDAGQAATATFAAPLDITTPERTVLVEGTGDKIADGDLVNYGVTIFDATTGEVQTTEGYDAPLAPVVVSIGSGADQFFGCATIGSRLVMALPKTQSSAAAVWVLDVLGVSPKAAWGEDQAPTDGFPTVELADDGAPTVTLPEGDMPTAFEKAVLKKGDGAVVQNGDNVTVQYHGVSWNSGEVFDQSWGKAPFSFVAGNGVVQGFTDAVVGETVGSQVIAVLPPAVAYGEGEINDNNLTGQTLVFVIDILAAEPAAPAAP